MGNAYRDFGLYGWLYADCGHTDSALYFAAGPCNFCTFSDYAVLLSDRYRQKSAFRSFILRYLLADIRYAAFDSVSAAFIGKQGAR